MPSLATNPPKVYRVSELGTAVKSLLESEFGEVWVEGETSGLSRPSSGHIYFDLKDDQGLITVAFFRGSQRGLQTELQNGRQVRVLGNLTAYNRTSRYQIICRQIEEAGLGRLYEAFLRLKNKLEKEGLFDPARKRGLPALPRRIGIVTSPTGAALQDMLSVFDRRFPNLHIRIAPARVQGQGAAEEIVAGIERLNRFPDIDVIIVGRGGGSMEDLWAFNEEIVARAVAASRIPIISAVGHETDTSICDLVADLRAATPTEAAERVAGRKEEWEAQIDRLRTQLLRSMQDLVDRQHQHLDHTQETLGHLGRRHIQDALRRLRNVQTRLEGNNPRNRLKKNSEHIHLLQGRLQRNIEKRVAPFRETLRRLETRIPSIMQSRFQREASRLTQTAARMEALSPMAVLERGYSITRFADGRVVRRAQEVHAGDTLLTRLAEGDIQSTVQSASKTPPKETHHE